MFEVCIGGNETDNSLRMCGIERGLMSFCFERLPVLFYVVP